MAKKDSSTDQSVVRRRPRQQRSLHKVELILEASIQLLDEGGLAAFTTNAVAARAGVSVGTLYQYFPGKKALLDALSDRELGILSRRVMAVLQDPEAATPRTRIPRFVGAVTESYGRRSRVHRLVMEHSLGRSTSRLRPLFRDIVAQAAGKGGTDDQAAHRTRTFVATHAISGVLRAMILEGDDAPSPAEIEPVLTLMLDAFWREHHHERFPADARETQEHLPARA